MLTTTLLRWFSVWLKVSLTVLLALGPFLHAHYGASHVSGLHLDGTDLVHVTHSQVGQDAMHEGAPDDESAAVGVATSYPRELQLDTGDVAWVALASVWVLFVLLSCPHVPSEHRTPVSHSRRRLYAPGTPPPTLAPPL